MNDPYDILDELWPVPSDRFDCLEDVDLSVLNHLRVKFPFKL